MEEHVGEKIVVTWSGKWPVIYGELMEQGQKHKVVAVACLFDAQRKTIKACNSFQENQTLGEGFQRVHTSCWTAKKTCSNKAT